jgi:hypothetical protein
VNISARKITLIMPQIREAKTFLPLTEYSSAKDHKYTLRMTCGEKK